VLAAAVPLVLGAAITRPAFAIRMTELKRSLTFEHLHTGESVTAVYKIRGRYVQKGMSQIDHILRDWRTGETVSIDKELLDLVWELQRSLDSQAPVEIISGYRAPKTNKMLAATNSGVVEHSQHTLAKALDFRLADRNLDSIRKAAIAMQRGGVGYYPQSGFIHVDTGRVRVW
jgi:uncharacterized protein YcbK (DUF882 family)